MGEDSGRMLITIWSLIEQLRLNQRDTEQVRLVPRIREIVLYKTMMNNKLLMT